jgi:hypothetical protein
VIRDFFQALVFGRHSYSCTGEGFGLAFGAPEADRYHDGKNTAVPIRLSRCLDEQAIILYDRTEQNSTLLIPRNQMSVSVPVSRSFNNPPAWTTWKSLGLINVPLVPLYSIWSTPLSRDETSDIPSTTIQRL